MMIPEITPLKSRHAPVISVGICSHESERDQEIDSDVHGMSDDPFFTSL